MAEIVADVEHEKAVRLTTNLATPVSDGWSIEVDGRVFCVSDDEITPEEARDVARTSRLVIKDSCGCGGGCGYDVWEGSQVSGLLKAGAPTVDGGSIWQIQDESGSVGVFLMQSVQWGPLR